MVDADRAPFVDVPCFLPFVPRMTSCKPNQFQQMEYLNIEQHQESTSLSPQPHMTKQSKIKMTSLGITRK